MPSFTGTIQDFHLLPILTAAIIIIVASTRFTNIFKSQLQKRYIKSIIRKDTHSNISNNDSNGIQVSSIHVHPIKSLRAVNVPSTRLTNLGLAGDRTLMLVRPSSSTGKYRFVTQRQCPKLATINASLPTGMDNNLTKITLSHDESNQSIAVDITPSSLLNNHVRYNAGLWDDTVQVVDLGDEASSFFQSILTSYKHTDDDTDDYSDIRLVAQIPNQERRVDERYCPPATIDIFGRVPKVSLTDGFPILIASEASLKELNRRLKSKSKPAININRFRANIVIKGDSLKAFEEDEWKAIRIGKDGPILHVVKGCPRCKQSCTDQMTGERFEEPLETLKEFRALGKNAEDVYFAQNVVLQPGMNGKEICVGDEVHVLTRGEPVWDKDSVQAE